MFCRAVGGPSADVLDGKSPDHPLKTSDFGGHFVTFQGARTEYFDEKGTAVFELERPQVLDSQRGVLTGHGAQPRAERREIAVDLREDWPQALRDRGFDAAKR